MNVKSPMECAELRGVDNRHVYLSRSQHPQVLCLLVKTWTFDF